MELKGKSLKQHETCQIKKWLIFNFSKIWLIFIYIYICVYACLKIELGLKGLIDGFIFNISPQH